MAPAAPHRPARPRLPASRALLDASCLPRHAAEGGRAAQPPRLPPLCSALLSLQQAREGRSLRAAAARRAPERPAAASQQEQQEGRAWAASSRGGGRPAGRGSPALLTPRRGEDGSCPRGPLASPAPPASQRPRRLARGPPPPEKSLEEGKKVKEEILTLKESLKSKVSNNTWELYMKELEGKVKAFEKKLREVKQTQKKSPNRPRSPPRQPPGRRPHPAPETSRSSPGEGGEGNLRQACPARSRSHPRPLLSSARPACQGGGAPGPALPCPVPAGPARLSPACASLPREEKLRWKLPSRQKPLRAPPGNWAGPPSARDPSPGKPARPPRPCGPCCCAWPGGLQASPPPQCRAHSPPRERPQRRQRTALSLNHLRVF
ncbi:basic proline-rich protein-like [Heteronotia binoei]|uniref:basic proline-rich protein-like n=1 Tax=Heteronotia binoei TaxID=13085 RepID=UPI00292EA8FA|nr:basic proline-rich protein-like [Heteronotia binoei]